jgi:hypothetical protein
MHHIRRTVGNSELIVEPVRLSRDKSGNRNLPYKGFTWTVNTLIGRLDALGTKCGSRCLGGGGSMGNPGNMGTANTEMRAACRSASFAEEKLTSESRLTCRKGDR